ncbi:hypothetical protein A3860_26740 [Niastella vici]|uniref:Uncharacterized protein n=2 Tax=Niastella vici TaxID=1703345 RepID=A0A1V9FX14_9BACT|nr:hypothetical protein A3860_26740 [Niastella vici]
MAFSLQTYVYFFPLEIGVFTTCGLGGGEEEAIPNLSFMPFAVAFIGTFLLISFLLAVVEVVGLVVWAEVQNL